jgi:anti-sigma regulatory factor (Ser/Thr protein kinase)
MHVKTMPLSHSADSAALARRFVCTTLEEWGCSELADSASLVTSELVTNALKHAQSTVDVTMSFTPETSLWIEVHDQGVGQIQRRDADADATAGRGLEIVEKLSRTWGAVTDAEGKSVWVEMPPGSSSAPA